MTEARTRLNLATDGALCRNYTVTLDGVKQDRCVLADAKEGYVVRYRNNAFGLPVRDRQGHRVTERIAGVVVIEPKA